jgi:hypothetical protein
VVVKQLTRTHGFILGIFVFSNQQLEFALFKALKNSLRSMFNSFKRGKFSLLIGENKDTARRNQ